MFSNMKLARRLEHSDLQKMEVVRVANFKQVWLQNHRD